MHCMGCGSGQGDVRIGFICLTDDVLCLDFRLLHFASNQQVLSAEFTQNASAILNMLSDCLCAIGDTRGGIRRSEKGPRATE